MVMPIELKAVDLLDRFGFEDGYLFFEFLHHWLKDAGHLEHYFNNDDSFSHYYFSSQLLLITVLDKYLVPLLPNSIYYALEFSNNQNNPVLIDYEKFYSRAKIEEIDPNGGILGLEIDVSMRKEDLDELAQDLYKVQGRGYLMLYKVLLLNMPGDSVFNDCKSERVLLNYPGIIIRRLLDKLTLTYNDQEFELASHLYFKVNEFSEFENFFKLAKVL